MQTLTTNKTVLSWRAQQLSWFSEPVMIQQDYDVVEYMKLNHIRQARIHGDGGFFSTYVEPVNGKCNFSIWIENQVDKLFDFKQLVDQLNSEIHNNLSEQGVLYFAVNKFLCQPQAYDLSLPEDYDDAVVKYLKSNIKATMEIVLLHRNIKGSEFNWVHPLTRFYFRK